ncbi:hypothetical protein CAter10_2674 [Collimonas arenae]|nr:hypothetical protein CAter10_2674 [Collimonas arenae]
MEYALLLVLVAMVLFVSVDDASLLGSPLDAVRQLNYHYVQGMGFGATPI